MRMSASVHIDGFDTALANVVDDAVKVIDKHLSDTADFVKNDAKATSVFADKSGNLRKSIKKRKSKFVNGGYIVVASGRNTKGEKGNHAHLIEYGHVKVLWGKETGERVPPYPFMRPAAEKGNAFLAAKIGSKS